MPSSTTCASRPSGSSNRGRQRATFARRLCSVRRGRQGSDPVNTLRGTSLTLPVKGGLASTKKLNDVLLHRGAVRFATKTKSVVVRHLTLYKLGKQAHLAATIAGKIVRLANISGLSAATHGKTATVSGEVHLSAAVAALINKLLNKHVVSAGYDFGSFTSALTIK